MKIAKVDRYGSYTNDYVYYVHYEMAILNSMQTVTCLKRFAGSWRAIDQIIPL